jgi:hypothetical protein
MDVGACCPEGAFRLAKSVTCPTWGDVWSVIAVVDVNCNVACVWGNDGSARDPGCCEETPFGGAGGVADL